MEWVVGGALLVEEGQRSSCWGISVSGLLCHLGCLYFAVMSSSLGIPDLSSLLSLAFSPSSMSQFPVIGNMFDMIS